jgi:uncharacterized membrane protein
MQPKGTSGERIAHRAFLIGIWIKGFDGILELVGGLIFLFGSPSWLSHEIVHIAQHAFHHDPGNFIANGLRTLAANMSVDAKFIGAIYLFANGFVKVLIAVGILRRKLWCYPAGIAVIGLLICLQSIRLCFHFSHLLLFGTALDVVIVLLIAHEYHRARPHNLKAERTPRS